MSETQPPYAGHPARGVAALQAGWEQAAGERDGYRAALWTLCQERGIADLLETLCSLSSAARYRAPELGGMPWAPIDPLDLPGHPPVIWKLHLLERAGLIAQERRGYIPTALGAALVAAQPLDNRPQSE